jgi:hypothetical protein
MSTPNDPTHTHKIMYDCVQERRRIGAVCGVFAKDEACANARLLAAAPSLLQAVKDYLELESCGPNGFPCYCEDPYYDGGRCHICTGRAAVALAERKPMEGSNGEDRRVD